MKEEIRHIETMLKEAIEDREDAKEEGCHEEEIYCNGAVNAIRRVVAYLNI